MAMTQAQRDAAYADRWARLKEQLDAHTATPLMLVGVGHNGPDKGRIVICSIEEISDYELAGMLRIAAATLTDRTRCRR